MNVIVGRNRVEVSIVHMHVLLYVINSFQKVDINNCDHGASPLNLGSQSPSSCPSLILYGGTWYSTTYNWKLCPNNLKRKVKFVL